MNDKKHNFSNDYSELAHPQVLQALAAATGQFSGYGEDVYCQAAKDLIKQRCGEPASQADVHFVSGGTQANLIVISSILRSHEAVVSTSLGHIYTNETGAIEATGHKVCAVPTVDGKLDASKIDALFDEYDNEHHVRLKAVYVSQSTELGTVYTPDELAALSAYCKNQGLYLFADGARLGSALNSRAWGLDYADFAALVDVFYIGGTKNGAMYGEAIVITNDELKADFRYNIKQRGALLGKSAAMGIQFQALFEDRLYDQLAQHANAMCQKLSEGITALGYKLFSPQQTNMIFPVFPTDIVSQMHALYDFYDREPVGDGFAVRLVTSWATPVEMVDQFLEDLAELS
ncbi:MAG: aminotransferase class I/II-fold pyridoxal phosphate-dependent enzyme [Coriobacteriia bacterium]|nr:aminotransferase class I/II-fold pyridoxal phosphate-dependent enzyme [Coriobacteriia bacterium]